MRHLAEADRVRANTALEINQQIDTNSRQRLREAASLSPQDLTSRLEELNAEWDFERTLELEAAATGLAAVALAWTIRGKALWLPGFVSGMLLLHAVTGWYPMLPLFRRWGIRTQMEIDRERYAVKALRGDFDDLVGDTAGERARAAWRAVHG
jgi:hypothetical protein